MSYKGYLLKFGGENGDILPESYIYKDSYKARIEVQDLDSGRNANGVLKRNVLSHVSAVVTFTVKPCHEKNMEHVLSLLRNHYITSANSDGIYVERKIRLYFFCPEYDKYFTMTFYATPPEPTIMQTYHSPNDLRYDAMGLEFIAY